MGKKSKQIGIGDIVKVYGTAYLYIVLEVQDFSSDTEYKLAKIYPQTITNVISVENLNDVALFLKRGTKEYDQKLKSLKIQREEKGWGEAGYIKLLKANLKDWESLNESYSEIDYSSFKTIDECLDVINDLNSLYEVFGDEEYLEKKKIVIEKLTSLSK